MDGRLYSVGKEIISMDWVELSLTVLSKTRDSALAEVIMIIIIIITVIIIVGFPTLCQGSPLKVTPPELRTFLHFMHLVAILSSKQAMQKMSLSFGMMNDLPFPPTYVVIRIWVILLSQKSTTYFGRANFAVEAVFMPLMSFVLYLLGPGEEPISTTIAP